jgi:hypothetical protein
MSEEMIVSTQGLDEKTLQIAQTIINEEDVDKIKDLTHLFNLNQAKKNVIRVMKLNGLLDTVSDKIIERFEKYPDNFSSADLLNYLQVTQNAIDKANKNLSLVEDTPVIQVNHNNQVNLNIIDSYDRDSKERVMEFIKSVLAQSNTVEEAVDYIEIKEEVDTNE